MSLNSTLGINRAILTALDLQDQHPPGRIDDDEINFAFLHDLELVAELAGSEPGVAVVDNAVVRKGVDQRAGHSPFGRDRDVAEFDFGNQPGHSKFITGEHKSDK